MVSTTLFVLITWVRVPPCVDHDFFHSFPSQHLVIDLVRLYIAFHGSETEEGADLYYIRVTSTMSLIKTSVYLAETIVSDLFIVRIYPPPFSRCALYRSGRAPSYIGAMLYGTRASPSSFSQSSYISQTSVCLPIISNAGGTLNAHFWCLLQGPGSRQPTHCRASGRTSSSTRCKSESQTHSSPVLSP
jgi:hypothetical protein